MAYIPELLAFQETLASSYDLSTSLPTFTSSDISDYNKFSIQFTCTGFKGTANLLLEQSLNGTNWDTVENSEITVTSATCDFTLQQQNWASKYIRVRYTSVQEGLVTINLLAKR